MTIAGNREMRRQANGLIDSSGDGDRGECRKWIGRPGLSVCVRVSEIGGREGHALAIGNTANVVEDKITGARLPW